VGYLVRSAKIFCAAIRPLPNSKLDAGDAVVGDFVLADVAGGGDFDLVDPDDGDVGDVAARKARGDEGS
jgi:hypothetical protein